MLCNNNTAGLQPIRKKYKTLVCVFTHDYKLPSMLLSEKKKQIQERHSSKMSTCSTLIEEDMLTCSYGKHLCVQPQEKSRVTS